ncbi:aromatic amino acid aminotransferase [Spathaspora passalidarum NRRL Y-27907]|uniref:aromatic-amino-acid transaminase n=1 Tax=Spathaspora passalidarum (strain NRRL Y-27907 / 11-Y1) TaxID=619300 RepID=G3AKC6_SPAPN|nr:aromatic amino acid aminotransferase [Spathaspora passalidarum NRRL Y-27907]EGW33585.1 aromatic amino acid aminotransferase [Spathaspora passalidarum NRRL Y-27907]
MTVAKPQSKDLTHLLSDESKSRQNSPLKSAFKYFNQPGMTFLGGGLPLSDYFPFDKITADIPTPSFDNGIGAQITEETKSVVEVFKRVDLNDPAAKNVPLARSLQYGYTEGQPEIIDFIRTHTDLIHKVPYADWDVVASVGNTESWDSTLRTFCTRGDSILVEEYSFSSALETAHALGVNTIPVTMDEFGLIPSALEELLKNWIGKTPRLLYTICTGQNPTGSSLSAERRKQIYEIACKYDFIIIEDEPYYFLQMETYTKDKSSREGNKVHDHQEFIDALVPSFLSLDVEGRVVRLDSFSKVLAPGLRFGWIVGQARLLERYVRLHEVSIQCPSGFTQSLTNALLQKWGQSGYLDWLIGLRAEYTKKRDVAIDTVDEHFPKDVCSYNPPVAGMFFTITIDASKHPKFDEFGQDPIKVETAIYEEGIKEGALMIPGSWFKSEGQSSPPQKNLPHNPAGKTHIFFRGTYAAVPLDQLIVGLTKFSRAVKTQFQIDH